MSWQPCLPAGWGIGFFVQGNIIFTQKTGNYTTTEEKMRLAKYGRKQWLTATFVLLLLAVFSCGLMYFSLSGGCFLLAFSLLFWGMFLALFRDPHRVVGQDKSELVSPADGIVKDMELIPNASCEDAQLRELFGSYDILRIGIVQSVFDVHVNRVPCAMNITVKSSRECSVAGKTKENAFVLLGGTGEMEGTSFPVALRQISGSRLRRIVCDANEGDILKKGRKYGMIHFGSRTELYLPAKSPVSITANIGERVFAGKSVLALFCREKMD